MAIVDNSSSFAGTGVARITSASVAISRKLLPQPKTHPGPLAPRETRASLGYADVGLFFVSVFLLAAAIRVAVRFHILDHATADRPPLFLQVAIWLFLIALLYLIVRFRHGSRATTTNSHLIHIGDLLLLWVSDSLSKSAFWKFSSQHE